MADKNTFKNQFVIRYIGGGEWVIGDSGKGLYTNDPELVVEKLINYINTHSREAQIKFTRMENKFKKL